MKIEINEEELQDWAKKQIQKRMGDRINTLMHKWDWNSYMKDAVDEVVRKKVSDEAINNIIGSVDKDRIIKIVGDVVACEIANNM